MIYKPKPARHPMFKLSPQFLTQFKIRWRCSRRVTGFQHGVTYLLWLIYGNTQLEIVNSFFKYLGIIFSTNGMFAACIDYQYEQGLKAMYALINLMRIFNLSIDLRVKLFDQLVVPVSLYGCDSGGITMLINWRNYIILKYCK